jgi:hypothetical protein
LLSWFYKKPLLSGGKLKGNTRKCLLKKWLRKLVCTQGGLFFYGFLF